MPVEVGCFQITGLFNSATSAQHYTGGTGSFYVAVHTSCCLESVHNSEAPAVYAPDAAGVRGRVCDLHKRLQGGGGAVLGSAGDLHGVSADDGMGRQGIWGEGGKGVD